MPRTPNTRLRLLLEAADLTQSQLAHAVRTVAAETGRPVTCGQTVVSRWLNGTQPRPPAGTYLLEALSRRLGRCVTAHEAGLTQAPAKAGGLPALSWEAHPVQILAKLAGSESDPARRRLFGASVFSLAHLALPDVPSTPAAGRRPSLGGGQRATMAHAAQMQAMATAFASAAGAGGGGSIRASLAAYLTHDLPRLLHAPATESIHRHLLVAAGQLTLLLGNVCADCGDDGLAQRYHHTAARLAREAQDHSALAIALRTMAAHAYNLGHHGPAVVNLAQRAAETARSAPPAVQSYAQAHLAVLLAHHDRHAALAALARAEHHHQRADDTPGPFTAYPAGGLYYQRAQVLAALGDRAGAGEALTASLRIRGPGEHRAATLTRARLAETRLRMGHLEAACTHWQYFLDAYPDLHSTAARRHLTSLRQLLTPHQRHPDAAALLRQAATLT
ncbi:hypothetical protein ACPCKL_16960 [Streptomyces cellulosae]